jgi:ankyrin repeat protein
MQTKTALLIILLAAILLPCGAQTQQASLNEALIAAAKQGDAAAVKELLAKGATVNARTNYGGTALHFAADRGHLEVLKVLVEAGADVNAKDDFYKMTPLMMALTHRRAEAVSYLQQVAIAQKATASAPATAQAPAKAPVAKATDPALNEALINAAKRGDLAAVKDLLAKGADVNAKTRYDQTPLMFAADKGHVEVVKLLLAAGADVNVVDTFYKSFTALVGATREGHAEVVKLLLEKGARSKEQALIIGTQAGHLAVVKVVLELGGLAPETLNRALESANHGERKEIAALIKQAGATANAPKPLKGEVQVNAALLQKYAGTYRIDEARQYTFIVQNGKLSGWDVRQYSIPLAAIDKNVFRLFNDDNRTVTFNEENGKIVSITVYQNGFKQNYNRVEDK